MREYLKAMIPIVAIAGLILVVWAVGHYGAAFFSSFTEAVNQWGKTDITDQQFRHWVIGFLGLISVLLVIRRS